MRKGFGMRWQRGKNLRMLHASKTPDESGNYNHSVRVTYGLGISMKYAGNRRGEVPSPNGLGNPTPTENLRLDSYTDSKRPMNRATTITRCV